jgi:hypothetical protein
MSNWSQGVDSDGNSLENQEEYEAPSTAYTITQRA